MNFKEEKIHIRIASWKSKFLLILLMQDVMKKKSSSMDANLETEYTGTINISEKKYFRKGAIMLQKEI